MRRQLQYTIGHEYDKKTINDYLRKELGVSGSLIKQMKKHDDGILLNGKQAYVNHSLTDGDILKICVGFDDEFSENIVPSELALDIIYEDEDLLIVNKPPYIPSHPSLHHYEDSLGNAVIGHYEKIGKTMVYRCVNRLDKGTSGICVIAKHAYSQECLKKQLHSDSFLREYTAIVCGDIDNSGFVEQPIGRCDNSMIKRMVTPFGDYAYTSFTPLLKGGNMTVVKLRLKTGRTHQIRVHMAYIGHQLVGDFLYGSESSIIARTALHSSHISLVHPVTKEQLSFDADLPNDMKALINSYILHKNSD